MKALQTLIYLAKGYGYKSSHDVSIKEKLNWRTVNKAHEFLLNNKLIQYDEINKIWVFKPFGYVHKIEIQKAFSKVLDELEEKDEN